MDIQRVNTVKFVFDGLSYDVPSATKHRLSIITRAEILFITSIGDDDYFEYCFYGYRCKSNGIRDESQTRVSILYFNRNIETYTLLHALAKETYHAELTNHLFNELLEAKKRVSDTLADL